MVGIRRRAEQPIRLPFSSVRAARPYHRFRWVLLLTLVGLGFAGCADRGDEVTGQREADQIVTSTAPSVLSSDDEPPGPTRGGNGGPTIDGGESAAASTGLDWNPVSVVGRVQAAVVTVVNEQRSGAFGAGPTREAGRGTGFAVDDKGHVVTNEHVVHGGDRFHVILADGEKRAATMVGADPLSDLAIVRVDGGVPSFVPFGDSDDLQVGQPVLAIGSPLGEFTNTATDGIIGGLGRDFPGVLNRGELGYSNLIQHNAAINPGNSGGPLLNAAAEVVGVNTLGIPRTEQGVPAQGLFFAIPANTVREIADQLIETGRVAYPSLGIDLIPITEELASQYELPVDYGVYVRWVAPGGPADQAAIREGDFLLAFGSRRIDHHDTFAEVLFEHRPGETVNVTLLRHGAELRVQATLTERSSE